MPKCGFCDKVIEKGKGKLYVYKSGSFVYFCKSKCEKSLIKLNRKAKNLKWTKHYKKIQASS